MINAQVAKTFDYPSHKYGSDSHYTYMLTFRM